MDDIIEQTRAVLATTPARWASLVETLPSALLTRPAAPGEWSALQCLLHLLDTERYVFPERVRAFLAGADFPAFDPDSQGTLPGEQPPREAVAEFTRLRGDSLALLAQLTASNLPQIAVHSELGRVTLGELLHEWAAHDLMHTVQAERALMQPFIAGSGPWRSYFVDHDLSGRPPENR